MHKLVHLLRVEASDSPPEESAPPNLGLEAETALHLHHVLDLV